MIRIKAIFICVLFVILYIQGYANMASPYRPGTTMTQAEPTPNGGFFNYDE